MSGISKAREAALETLCAVENDGAYLNIAIKDIAEKYRLDSRDGALMMLIAYGVERNRRYIDNIIEHLSSVKMKKISDRILNILRIGVYSLRFLDKVPQRATINECVNMAKRYGHRGSSGFVNALLRNAASSPDFLPEKGTDEYLAVFYSYPEWIIGKWRSEGVADIESLLKAGNENPPTYLRRNALKGDFPIPEGIEKSNLSKEAYIYRAGGAFYKTPLYREGFFSVQDAASQTAAECLDVKHGMRVLDMCAAPGGKSEYIAEMMGNEGEVISCDIYPHKTELIEKNARRLGIDIIKTKISDAEAFNAEFENAFDRVLLDAPCSGLGIIRRKPDIKWKKGAVDCSALAQTQYKMLRNAMRYVKKGGIIVYSTCTVSKVENERTAETFLMENKNFAPFPTDFMIDKGYRQFLPNINNTDGFFIARFIRRD